MFSEKLIEARKEKELTQEQLAEQLYVTRQAVSRWERGTAEPDLQTLGRLCKILGVSPEYFIEFSQKCEPTPFKKIKWSERHSLCWQFIAKHKALWILSSFLPFVGGLSLGFAIFEAVRLIANRIDLLQYLPDPVAITMFIVGFFVMALLFFAGFVYIRIILSALFNKWLLERNILRTFKIL